MKILEIPILNDDGSIQYTAKLSANEVQLLLGNAINLFASIGLGAHKRYQDEMVQDNFDSPGLND
jgi:hypothetical protein